MFCTQAYAFFFCFDLTSAKNVKMIKKDWKHMKKVFRPAFGCAQHPKAGQNSQHFCHQIFPQIKPTKMSGQNLAAQVLPLKCYHSNLTFSVHVRLAVSSTSLPWQCEHLQNLSYLPDQIWFRNWTSNSSAKPILAHL